MYTTTFPLYFHFHFEVICGETLFANKHNVSVKFDILLHRLLGTCFYSISCRIYAHIYSYCFVFPFCTIYVLSFSLFLQDYNDDIRQEQMWEMQVLSSQRGNGGIGKNDDSSGEPSSIGVEYVSTSTEDRLSAADTMEGAPESPQAGEHPALRGIQPGKSTEPLGFTYSTRELRKRNGVGDARETEKGGTLIIATLDCFSGIFGAGAI